MEPGQSRLSTCHVGSPLAGFIPESKWVFRSKSTIDCREEMTADTFKYWFLNRFTNYMDEGSIIIMDNAGSQFICSYFMFPKLKKVPNTSAKNISCIGSNRKHHFPKKGKELSF
jgi:hypothetical protein